MNKLALLSPVLALALAPLNRVTQETPAAEEAGIRLTWSGPVLEDQQGVAGSHAVRMASYMQMNHPEWRTEIFRPYSASLHTLITTADFASMRELEKFFEASNAEEGLRALDEEYAGIVDTEAQESFYLLPVTSVEPSHQDRPFRWTRFNRATFGKYALALEHARAVAEHVNANYSETRFEVFAAYFEKLGQIHWVADFESPDAWLATRAKLWKDPEYVRLMEQADGLYVDGVWEEDLAWRIR